MWEYIYHGLVIQSSHVRCTPLVSRLRLTLLYRQYTLHQLLVYIEEASYVSTIVDSIAFTSYDSYISIVAVDLRVTTLGIE